MKWWCTVTFQIENFQSLLSIIIIMIIITIIFFKHVNDFSDLFFSHSIKCLYLHWKKHHNFHLVYHITHYVRKQYRISTLWPNVSGRTAPQARRWDGSIDWTPHVLISSFSLEKLMCYWFIVTLISTVTATDTWGAAESCGFRYIYDEPCQRSGYTVASLTRSNVPPWMATTVSYL